MANNATPTRKARAGVALADLVLAVGVFALGLFFLIGAFSIRVLASYANVGPRFLPLIIATGLLVCGTLLALQALRGKRAQPQMEENVDLHVQTDTRAVVLLSVVFVVYILILEPIGFILASTFLFWGTAFSFKSRRYLRDGALGFVLAVVVYLVFTRFLSLNLPAGLLSFL